MSQVRSTARMCYRRFARTWPERSRRLVMLTPLILEKNVKWTATAISCIISVYTYHDSLAVLNSILGLFVEQNSLRRVLR
ncbi:Hypothetical predicted protein [Olea europaea subsp. europaea]|uniref:Uncharacterized protein n=1 Tax=Olea europaea subsp. europaea TaxID=158383 RepID=A0A8S0SZB8_OLEEU|nr:Hypothetical predicted protein [Olea europaea subsp. europaea]